jgi:hypothetical protein
MSFVTPKKYAQARDPYSHRGFGSVSRRAKSMRFRARNTGRDISGRTVTEPLLQNSYCSHLPTLWPFLFLLIGKKAVNNMNYERIVSTSRLHHRINAGKYLPLTLGRK